jgi:hypothetical protein
LREKKIAACDFREIRLSPAGYEEMPLRCVEILTSDGAELIARCIDLPAANRIVTWATQVMGQPKEGFTEPNS